MAVDLEETGPVAEFTLVQLRSFRSETSENSASASSSWLANKERVKLCY